MGHRDPIRFYQTITGRTRTYMVLSRSSLKFYRFPRISHDFPWFPIKYQASSIKYRVFFDFLWFSIIRVSSIKYQVSSISVYTVTSSIPQLHLRDCQADNFDKRRDTRIIRPTLAQHRNTMETMWAIFFDDYGPLAVQSALACRHMFRTPLGPPVKE